MRSLFAFLAAGVAVSTIGSTAPASHATGPPPGHTGGFGEPTCQACHEGEPLNAYGGSVTILGLPEAYEPGLSYLLTVVLRADETAVAGFQLSARFAGGPDAGITAGRLSSTSPRVTITEDAAARRYAHHTVDGSVAPDSDGSSWTVEWVAPAAGGAVVFHVAANSGNGDNSPLMDLVYQAEFSVPAA